MGHHVQILLQSFDGFAGKEILSERDLQDYAHEYSVSHTLVMDKNYSVIFKLWKVLH